VAIDTSASPGKERQRVQTVDEMKGVADEAGSRRVTAPFLHSTERRVLLHLDQKRQINWGLKDFIVFVDKQRQRSALFVRAAVP